MIIKRFVVFGDVHGKQDAMYETALRLQDRSKMAIDAVLQVGDFETIRTLDDLRQYYAPAEYHRVSDIVDYCSGVKQAPFFTAFIGGNHEAWTVLAEHNDGGFICPNIYYLGRAKAIDVKGVRVGGLTGIFNRDLYDVPLPEVPDWSWEVYRREAIDKLRSELKLDILLLHDWIRPYSEINPTDEESIPDGMRDDRVHTPTYELVTKIRPKHVFMGHKHVPYVEGGIGETHVVGLREFRDGTDPHSYHILEIEVNE